MLYQTVPDDEEKRKHMDVIAETIPRPSKILGTVGTVTVATMHMDDRRNRQMEDLRHVAIRQHV